MSKFIVKRTEVEAFKYGVDEAPDWFHIRVLNNRIYTYPTHCQIETATTWIRCNNNEWVVYYPETREIFVFNQSAFDKNYEPLNN